MLGLPQLRPERCPPTAGPWYWCASALCTYRAAHRCPPAPLVLACIKRGDQYLLVDAARLDIDDHMVTLSPSRGASLVLTTATAARANYDRTRSALVLVPSASKDEGLWDGEWKGWSRGGGVSRKSDIMLKTPPPSQI